MQVHLTLTAERPAHGGYCVARHEGKVVFVRFALPGETVIARVTEDRKNLTFADAIEIITPAPERVSPRCPHYTACGGCHWQHADYAAELRFKHAVVVEQFVRFGGVADPPVLPVIPSPDPYGYRTHITLHGAPGGGLGFVGMAGGVIPIETCPIAAPALDAAIGRMRLLRRFHPPGMRLRLHTGDDGTVEQAVMTGKGDDDDATGDADMRVVTHTVRGRVFRCSAGAFFQVNLAGAEALVEAVLAHLTLSGSEHVLDLYSGGGLFSAFIAPLAHTVTAIESAPASIADARVNLADRPNVTLQAGRVEDLLPGLRADAVVLDPPRAGMRPAALEALIACAPRRIAYVSCDPATLARDCKRLIAAGWRLDQVQPVDMFPRTWHVECVAGLTRD